MKRNLLICLVFFSVNLIYSQQDSTQVNKKKKLSLRDPEDRALDLSAFLLERNGVMPVVIPVTEPAVGYGGGAAILYFHKRKKKYDSYVPPNVSGVVGLATENKTWAAGAFHSHIFGENRVRTLTAVLKGNIRYKYYGDNSVILENNPVGINLDTWLIYQKAQFRIGQTNLYIGASYTYLNSEVSFDTIPNRPIINFIIKRLKSNSTISAIKPAITYDNRNNTFTPTKGIKTEIGFNYSAQWLGSDYNYGTLNTDFFGYLPISPKFNSKYRFQGSFLFGDAPFYAYPFINLRGVPAMRYQNDATLLVETEWSYNLYRRWWLSVFSGTGKAFKDIDDFSSQQWVYNIGTGFRYNIARKLGVDMGADFAWGNGKDFAFYIVFGTSW
jgi:hypothetical protein